MQYYRTEGIILSSIKYRDYDQIATLFSREEGVLPLLIKRAYGKSEGYGTKTAPFVKAEHLFSKGKGELFLSREISTICYHLELRATAAHLEAASQLARMVLHSQMPAKAAPELYDLFSYYLKAMGTFSAPAMLVASFRLKLLRHEGLFGVRPFCSVCQCPLDNHYFFLGESFCHVHAQMGSIHLTPEESAAFYTLSFSRSLAELEALSSDPTLEKKILDFWHGSLSK